MPPPTGDTAPKFNVVGPRPALVGVFVVLVVCVGA